MANIMDPTNRERADRAKAYLLAASADDGVCTAIVDVITDLLHLARQAGLNPGQIIALAQLHFQAEFDEETATP